MNFIDRLLDKFEGRGENHRIITEQEVVENSRPLSSAIISLSRYTPKFNDDQTQKLIDAIKGKDEPAR